MRLFAETEGRGPELVLIHGWGMNGAIWEGLIAALGPSLRITRIDLPGHGHSPWDPAWAGLEDWVTATLQAAPQRALWIGWSLGALLALRAALRLPERVQALVLLAGTPRFVQADDWPHAVPPGTLAQFHQGLARDYQVTMDRFLALQVRGSADARTGLRRLRQGLAQRPAPDPRALETGLQLLRETDLRPDLGELVCPTQWVLGQRDSLVPAALAGDLTRLQPAAWVQVLAGAGHAPFLSHGPETAALIREALG